MPADFRLRPQKTLAEKTQEREWVEQTMFLDNDPLAAQARARVALWTFHGLLLLALGGLLWRACGLPWAAGPLAFLALEPPEIGRASCRAGVCQYVWISVVAV